MHAWAACDPKGWQVWWAGNFPTHVYGVRRAEPEIGHIFGVIRYAYSQLLPDRSGLFSSVKCTLFVQLVNFPQDQLELR